MLLERCLGFRAKMDFPAISNFRVIAALLGKNGQVYMGTNFEGAGMDDILCAERTAVVNANMSGVRQFTHIAVIGDQKFGVGTEPVTPCGACRQVLNEVAELSGAPITVISSNGDGTATHLTDTATLLPYSFGPKALSVDLGMHCVGHDSMSMVTASKDCSMERMSALALEALRSAYAPYYPPSPATALLTKSGDIFLGAEFQNASYGLTITALMAARAIARVNLGKNPEIFEITESKG